MPNLARTATCTRWRRRRCGARTSPASASCSTSIGSSGWRARACAAARLPEPLPGHASVGGRSDWGRRRDAAGAPLKRSSGADRASAAHRPGAARTLVGRRSGAIRALPRRYQGAVRATAGLKRDECAGTFLRRETAENCWLRCRGRAAWTRGPASCWWFTTRTAARRRPAACAGSPSECSARWVRSAIQSPGLREAHRRRNKIHGARAGGVLGRVRACGGDLRGHGHRRSACRRSVPAVPPLGRRSGATRARLGRH